MDWQVWQSQNSDRSPFVVMFVGTVKVLNAGKWLKGQDGQQQFVSREKGLQ